MEENQSPNLSPLPFSTHNDTGISFGGHSIINGQGDFEKGIEEPERLHISHRRDSLSSVKVDFYDPLDRDWFLKGIERLAEDIFRIKWIIEFREEKGPKVFQFVAGRHDITEYKNGAFKERFLVCVGKNMESYISNPQSVRALFEGWAA